MAKSKKKKLLPASAIVTQSNELVSARYTLPLGEQRLVLTMIARIQPDDEDFKPYRIGIGELADFLGVDKNSAYRECKKITEKLLTRVVKIKEPGRELQTNWVSSADYIDGSGMVNLCFDPLLKPYLLQLKGNFTSCKLAMLLSFKSQYTMRMYSFLKQYEGFKEREIELAPLRELLGLRTDQYKLYANFKTDLLKPIQKELAEKADLYFEFDEIKYGRRVGAIRFHLFVQQICKKLSVSESVPVLSESMPIAEDALGVDMDALLALVLKPHRAKKTVKTALDAFENKHGFDYVKRNILYSNEKADKSYAGFLNNALKEDWGHDWELDQRIAVTKKRAEVWERQGFPTEKAYHDFMFTKQMEAYAQASVKHSA
jgi:plasmid replication initiation protein